MHRLCQLLHEHEDWLLERVIDHAIRHGYASYTSTLVESWRASICGLTDAFTAAIEAGQTQVELAVDEDYQQDPIAAFVTQEAQRHRQRGVELNMFLGLFKYYRQSYRELIQSSDLPLSEADEYQKLLDRFFDRGEIAFCCEWAGVGRVERIRELQITNRWMTNEKNKYLTLFESLSTPVILIDNENYIENLNLAALSLLGELSGDRRLATSMDRSRFNGRLAQEAMPWMADELAAFARGGGRHLTGAKAIQTPGGMCYYQIKISRMRDVSGKFGGVLVVLNDETEIRLAQERATLARDAAEAANQAKTTFLANVSHELRTPLNAILGFSQLMAGYPDIPYKYQGQLEIVNRSGQHLLQMINEVLNLSQIEAGKMGLHEHEIDLYCLLDELVESLTWQAGEKQLLLSFDRDAEVPQYILVDETKLRQVLLNLMSNAIKFTMSGQVSLAVWLEQDRLHFRVTDTGPGISAAQRDNLFEPFVHSDAVQAGQTGSGLGLAISQRFVRLLGGEITVQSELGRGSAFQFSIPVAIAAPIVAGAPAAARTIYADLHSYRMLVVDDEVYNRLLMVKLLEPFGIQIREASGGQEAIEIWQWWQPHMIWLDMRMPMLDGYQVATQIKAAPSGQDTVIVAVTASAFQEQRAAMLAAGCDDLILKPLHQTEIEAMMDKHLHPRRVRQANEVYDVAAPAAVVSAGALSTLPSEWRSAFREAVEAVDPEAAERLIDQLDPQTQPLVGMLSELVAGYRFDTLQGLFEETDDDHPSGYLDR